MGVFAQVVAVKIKMPAILLLLLIGIVVGPVFKAILPDSAVTIYPDKLLGDLLIPIVGLSVGMILYEGGLTLRFGELRTGVRVITMLVTLGAFVTWLLAALAAVMVLDLPWGLALVFGAILTVSGPTVVLPLIRHIRPKGSSGPILRWEGIVIDPIGALLAVLVFEAVAAGGGQSAAADVFFGVVRTIVYGGGLGLAAGWLMAFLIRNYIIPDYLQNAVSFGLVIVTFAVADNFQKEAGLLATTVMGMYLANQKSADIEHILEFKENLRVLLISSLFVVLAARLELKDLQDLGIETVFFVIVLILVVRPVAVWVSTLKSRLNWRERVLLMSVAPRGIVAAAIAPVLALELADRYPEEAERLTPLMFAVIVGTVTVYGLLSPIVARRLNLADTNPQGVLILGGQPWARALGKKLKSLGVHVMIVDTNYSNTAAAWMDGVPAYHGSVLTDSDMEDIEMTGLGRFIALTPNDQVNTLAVQRMIRHFTTANVYRLHGRTNEDESEHPETQGRILSSKAATYRALTGLYGRSGGVLVTELSPEYTLEDFREEKGDTAIPLFVISESGKLTVLSPKQAVTPAAGQRVISIASNVAKDESEE